MALPSSGKFKVRCPVCKNIFILDAYAGKEFVTCSACGNRLKLPKSTGVAQKNAGFETLPKYREVPPREIRAEPINIRTSLPLIRAIIIKDIHGCLKYLIILLFIGIALALVISPIAGTAPTHDSYLDEIEQDYENDYEDEYPGELAAKIKAVETTTINNLYGLSLFITALVFIILCQTLYGTELRKGTIRSIALYPIDMNGITIAKVASISILSGIILFLIFFLPLLPFSIFGVLPNLPTIIFMAYFINVLFLIVIASIMHILTYLFKNVKLSFNRLIIIFTVIAIIFTETVLRIIGGFYIVMSKLSGAEADKFWDSWTETAKGLSVISPYHGWGRMLTSMLGFNTGGFDFFILGPIGLILVFFGFTLGKKIYLDVFNRD